MNLVPPRDGPTGSPVFGYRMFAESDGTHAAYRCEFQCVDGCDGEALWNGTEWIVMRYTVRSDPPDDTRHSGGKKT